MSMRPGKGNAIQYGKITLSSESEDMSGLVEVLKTLLNDKDMGYPESEDSEKQSAEDKELADAQKELAKEFNNNGGENKVPEKSKAEVDGSGVVHLIV